MFTENPHVPVKAEERDEVDLMVDVWCNELADLDPAVEGIVERIQHLDKKLRRSMEETLAESGDGLELGEWKTLAHLRRAGDPYRLSAGQLARRSNLSTGAMTNRLDRLEAAGLVRRLPDPDDRRSVLVELTPAGRAAWEETTNVQARKEALLASALSDREQEQLNRLLRRLMLAFADY